MRSRRDRRADPMAAFTASAGVVPAVGAFLLAEEPQGDDDWQGADRVDTAHTTR